MTEPTRWLSDEEQAAWRGLQRMYAQLGARLNRDLAGAGLSLQDYAVLVSLTDEPAGELRPFELGRILGWEKSRLSHHLARMVERGLVDRRRCPTDQRGWVISITDVGRRAIEAAAPTHVAGVREAFVDRLTPAQLRHLARITETVLAALEAECDAAE